ncbi:MAG: ABC transporter substrate-binding protein [Euryarchaeota archaeon]|nr:ABC transporter substrate-binding protein [Euryarchaeota archaeon]
MRTDILLVGMTMMLLLALPVAASDYTLGIFGNANEDETINMQDVTYTELIILEYRDKTELADGKHDGKINMQDVTQIELTILGKEKELTLIDDMDDVVTVAKPISSVVYVGHNAFVYETWRALGMADKIVGTTDRFIKPGGYRYSENYYPEMLSMRSVGTLAEPDFEEIVDIAPDLLYTDEEKYDIKDTAANKIPGLPVICMDIDPAQFTKNTRITGYVFDRRDEADEYIDWRNGWQDRIEDRTEGLSDGERPLVLMSSYTEGSNEFSVRSGDSSFHPMIVGAGGKNIGKDLTGYVKVDAEWIVDRNPEIIVFSAANTYCGYDFDDSSELAALYDDFMGRSDFAGVSAVVNKRVYFINYAHLCVGGASGTIGEAYMAKWFQPDIFADIDPLDMQQEFLEFQGIDLDLSDHGVFVYPE